MDTMYFQMVLAYDLRESKLFRCIRCWRSYGHGHEIANANPPIYRVFREWLIFPKIGSINLGRNVLFRRDVVLKINTWKLPAEMGKSVLARDCRYHWLACGILFIHLFALFRCHSQRYTEFIHSCVFAARSALIKFPGSSRVSFFFIYFRFVSLSQNVTCHMKPENGNGERGIFFESSDKINDSTEILEVIA